jgi:hypothetical protein
MGKRGQSFNLNIINKLHGAEFKDHLHKVWYNYCWSKILLPLLGATTNHFDVECTVLCIKYKLQSFISFLCLKTPGRKFLKESKGSQEPV